MQIDPVGVTFGASSKRLRPPSAISLPALARAGRITFGPAARSSKDQLLPLDGALLPLDGALLPLDGALLPLDGALLPLDGALLPLDGALLPLDGALLPLDGTSPQFDRELPILEKKLLNQRRGLKTQDHIFTSSSISRWTKSAPVNAERSPASVAVSLRMRTSSPTTRR